MKRISLFGALLSAVAVAAPLSAQASVTDAQRRSMGAALREAGVDLVFTNCTEKTAGVFRARDRKLTVCQNNIVSQQDLDETVAHEAMHVAQWCAGRFLGFGTNAKAPLHTVLSAGDEEAQKMAAEWLEWVNSKAPDNAKGIAFSSNYNKAPITNLLEREAYAMESDFQGVYDFLTGTCQVGPDK